MHNGRGTGGQLAQLKNIEQLQIIAATKSRHLTALDTATQGDEVNPMAPTVSQVPNLQTNIRLHPKPWLKSKVGGQVSDPQSPSTTSLTFKLAAPSQQFSFRLPDSALANTRNQGAPNQDVDSVSNLSGPPSSQASSLSPGVPLVPPPLPLMHLLFVPQHKVTRMSFCIPTVVLLISED